MSTDLEIMKAILNTIEKNLPLACLPEEIVAMMRQLVPDLDLLKMSELDAFALLARCCTRSQASCERIIVNYKVNSLRSC